MPIYEYQCKNCGLRFERFLRSAGERVACPRCRRADLEKLISAFAFNAKDKNGDITAGSSNCGSCTSNNCSTCAG